MTTPLFRWIGDCLGLEEGIEKDDEEVLMRYVE